MLNSDTDETATAEVENYCVVLKKFDIPSMLLPSLFTSLQRNQFCVKTSLCFKTKSTEQFMVLD